MTIPLLTDQRESPGMTFAEPLASDRFADMFAVAEKQQRLVNNVFAADQGREQGYDRRIAAVKAATGIELENPERGGYSLSERDLRRLTRDGPIDPMAYRRDQFEVRLNDVRTSNPDKAEALTFDDINAEAKTTAKAAEDEGNRPTGAGTVKAIAAELAGGVWGSRRDPLFVGSLFAGPTSAAGKAAFTRIASASLFQGLYNAGLTAAEQPVVQAWRAEIGARSGVQPALENVGMAFIFGMIPGAGIQGIKEAWPKEGLAPALRRVLGGHPEPGDLEAIHAGLTPDAPREAAALAAGAESVAADRATLTIPEPKGVAPALHDDMLAAALKRADDPAAASPEAVAIVRRAEPPPASDLQAAIEEAFAREPETARDVATGLFSKEPRDYTPQELARGIVDISGPDGPMADLLAKAEQDIKNGANPQAAISNFLDSVQSRLKTASLRKFMRDEPFADEVRQRITDANPKSEREAMVAADEALDDIGRREGAAVLREQIDAVRAEQDTARAARIAAETTEPAPKIPSKDPIGKIPWVDDSGNPKLLTAKAAAAVGERDDLFAMLVRSCK